MRSVLIMVAALVLASCGDDAGSEEQIGGGPGPRYGGSCNFPSTGSCTEYAEPQASASTEGECNNSGGMWASAQCPIAMRFASCRAAAPATRTYVYTAEAAAALKMTCPTADFTMVPQGGSGGTGGVGGYSGGGGAAGIGGMAGSAGVGGTAGGDEDAGI